MERIEIPLAQGWARGLVVAFESAASSAALDLNSFVHVKQVHGKDLIEVEPSHSKSMGPIGTADGLIAQGDWLKSFPKPLLIKTADCIPIIYIDHAGEAIAAIHAGWRGLAQGIHRAPFEQRRMDPKTTWVWIGPSLNGESFEVGEDMWKQFGRAAGDTSLFPPAPQSGKRFFNSWDFVRREFETLGVELIYNVEVNTFTDPNFNSYRELKSRGLSIPGAGNVSWVGFKP